MTDLERALNIKSRLVAMWDRGRGESPEYLAKIFNLSLESVEKVLGVFVPVPPMLPTLWQRLTRARNR